MFSFLFGIYKCSFTLSWHSTKINWGNLDLASLDLKVHKGKCELFI